MGAAAAYMSTVAAHAEAEAQRQRDQQEQARASQRQIHMATLANPNATAEQRQYAIDNLNKLNGVAGSKKGQSPYDVLGEHLQHVGQQLQDGGHPEAANPGVLHQLPALADGAVKDAAPVDASPAPAAAPAKPDAAQGLPPLISADPSMPPASTAAVNSDAPAPPAQAKALPPLDISAPAEAAPAAATTPTPNAPQFIGGPTPTPAHAYANGLAHGASHVISFLKDRAAAASAAYHQPGVSLPPLGDPLDASMIPSPTRGAPVKINSKPTAAEELDGSTDALGHVIDAKGADKGKFYQEQVFKNGTHEFLPISPTAGASGRAVPLHPISISDAQGMVGQGHDFGNDLATGKPIDASTLKPSQQIVPLTLPGGRIAYTVTSQNQTHLTVGNEVYAVPTMEQSNLASAGTGLGVAKPGQTSTTETPVVDTATGETRFVPKNSSRTPITTGLTPLAGGPAQSLPALTTSEGATGIPAPAPPRHLTPQAQSGHTEGPIPTPGTAPSAGSLKSSASGRLVPGVTLPGQVNNLRQRNTALNGTTTALENATKPDPETGKSYLDLFKPENAASRAKVADFIRLNDSLAEGEYNSTAASGDLHTLASFGVGIPEDVASSKNKALADSYARLKDDPAAVKAVADYYNMIGQIGGMRKATGANASQWSFSNLKQEVPSPLLDSSYQGVQNKMHNLANEVNSNAGPNLTARKFDTSLLAPPTASSGKTVSLKDAMALPMNKGKSADQVTADIKAHGHEVRP